MRLDNYIRYFQARSLAASLSPYGKRKTSLLKSNFRLTNGFCITIWLKEIREVQTWIRAKSQAVAFGFEIIFIAPAADEWE